MTMPSPFKKKAYVPPQPILFGRQIRQGAGAALNRANTNGSYGWKVIESPGILPTDNENELPNVKYRTPHGSKQQETKGQTNYHSTVLLEIEGRVQGASQAAVQDAIELMEYQIENAILTDYMLVAIVEEFSSGSVREITGEVGRLTAAVKMSITCTGYESFDAFAEVPTLTWPITPNALQQPPGVDLDRMRIFGDLIRPYDPNGAYSSPFTQFLMGVPRTSGPDGRNEFVVDVPFSNFILDSSGVPILDEDGAPILDSDYAPD